MLLILLLLLLILRLLLILLLLLLILASLGGRITNSAISQFWEIRNLIHLPVQLLPIDVLTVAWFSACNRGQWRQTTQDVIKRHEELVAAMF